MSVFSSRSKLANEVQRSRRLGVDPATQPEVLHARRDLAAENIAAYVERVVSTAPPLTADQRSRIAALLRGAVK